MFLKANSFTSSLEIKLISEKGQWALHNYNNYNKKMIYFIYFVEKDSQ